MRNLLTIVCVDHGATCEHKRQRDLCEEGWELRVCIAYYLHASISIYILIFHFLLDVLAVLVELLYTHIRHERPRHVTVQLGELQGKRRRWVIRAMRIAQLPSLQIERILLDDRAVWVSGICQVDIVLGQVIQLVSYLKAIGTGED